jgi:hypothetical protein
MALCGMASFPSLSPLATVYLSSTPSFCFSNSLLAALIAAFFCASYLLLARLEILAHCDVTSCYRFLSLLCDLPESGSNSLSSFYA